MPIARRFGAKLTPAGRLVYILQYRMGGRGFSVRRYTIGAHGTWTPDGAGKEAERLLVMVAQDLDPATEKKYARIVATDLAFDAYADRFLKIEVEPNWKGRSYAFADGIVRLFDGLPADRPAVRRSVFAILRRLMRWAKARGDIDTNPLEGFEAPSPVASRDRVLDDGELRLLLKASEELAQPFGSFIRLLLLTGQRRNEVAELPWAESNRGESQWLLPASRAKNGVESLIHLSFAAVAELDLRAWGDKWPRSGLVFSTTGKTPISGFSKLKKGLDAAMADVLHADHPDTQIVPWRLHDLRRTMATAMQRLRISGDVIEACENRLAGRSKSGSARD